MAPPAPLLPIGTPFPPGPPPTLSSTRIYIDSNAPDVSVTVRSQDSDYGAEDSELDDEIRTMFINVRQQTKKARNSMAQRYHSSPSVNTFNVGDLVLLHIDAKYRKSTTPAKLFCKVIRKPQPDMHELQCLHGILSSKYRTSELEWLPTTINQQIGNNTTRITLTKAVALIHDANPTAVWTPHPFSSCITFQVTDMV